jgi:hypothetical protein
MKNEMEHLMKVIHIDGIGGGKRNRNIIVGGLSCLFKLMIVYLDEKSISITKMEEYHNDGFSFYFEDVKNKFLWIF